MIYRIIVASVTPEAEIRFYNQHGWAACVIMINANLVSLAIGAMRKKRVAVRAFPVLGLCDVCTSRLDIVFSAPSKVSWCAVC